MKRSMVLLLVVAILAMMIPSFAMAEAGKPTITLGIDSYTKYFYYDDDYEYGDERSIYIGNLNAQLTGFTDEQGSGRDGYYKWTVDNESLVHIDDYGEMQNKWGNGRLYGPSYLYGEYGKTGTAKLTVTLYEDYEGTKEVTSASFTYTALKLETTKIEISVPELEVGNAGQFTVTVTPEQAYNRTSGLQWSSSDGTVLRVNKNGYYEAVGAGTATVTAIATYNTAIKAEATVTVKEATKKEETAPTLAFTTTTFELKSGIDLEDYLVTTNMAYNDSIVWTTSDRQVASVGSTGYVSPSLPGTATITARSKRFPSASASVTVTVKKEALTSIAFSHLPATVKDGSSSLNLWSYIDTDPYYYGTNYQGEIGWISSDPQVAYVDEGYLYNLKPGTVTITAFSKLDESVKNSFSIEVVAVPVESAAFTKATYALKIGESVDLDSDRNLTLKPANHSSIYVSWESSDDEVASVDDGEVYANKVGTATITMSIRNANDSIVTASTNVTVTEDAPTAIAFKKDAYTVDLSYRRYKKTVALKLTPADADLDSYDLYAESSNVNVLEAEVAGKYVYLTALKPGTVTVTVKSHANAKLSASTKVTVKPIALTSVAMAKSSLTIPVYEGLYGNTATIKTVIKPSDAYCSATWTTSDASVVYVSNTEKGDEPNEDGRAATLYAVGPGTATITVTATDGTNTYKASMKVTVKAAKVTKLSLNVIKSTVYMIKGGDNTLQLIATDSKTDAVVPVTWKTSNKKVATVNAKGLVTFKKAGKVKITATTKDGNNTKKTCTLTIKQLKVTKVVPAKKTLSMKVGEEATLKVTVKPAKAFNPAVSFKSSNKKVVTVDANGNLKAVKAGKAVITITAKDGSKKSAKVTITVKGTASNDEIAIGDETAVGTENNIELTLDGVDGIDDLFIDDEVVFEVNDTSALALD